MTNNMKRNIEVLITKTDHVYKDPLVGLLVKIFLIFLCFALLIVSL